MGEKLALKNLCSVDEACFLNDTITYLGMNVRLDEAHRHRHPAQISSIVIDWYHTSDACKSFVDGRKAQSNFADSPNEAGPTSQKLPARIRRIDTFLERDCAVLGVSNLRALLRG